MYWSFVSSVFCRPQYSTSNFRAHFFSRISSTCSNHPPPLTPQQVSSPSLWLLEPAPPSWVPIIWKSCLLLAHWSLFAVYFSTVIQGISWLRHSLTQPCVGISPFARFLCVTLSPKSLPPPPCSAPGSHPPVSRLTPRLCSAPPTCLLEPEVHGFLICFPSLTQGFL